MNGRETIFHHKNTEWVPKDTERSEREHEKLKKCEIRKTAKNFKAFSCTFVFSVKFVSK